MMVVQATTHPRGTPRVARASMGQTTRGITYGFLISQFILTVAATYVAHTLIDMRREAR